MNCLRRFLILLLLLPALASAGPVAQAFALAAAQAAGDEMCLTLLPASPGGVEDGEGGVAHLPCADCCLACAWPGGAPANPWKEAPLRRAFLPASPLLENVTATGPGDPMRAALWIRGPPAGAAVHAAA